MIPGVLSKGLKPKILPTEVLGCDKLVTVVSNDVVERKCTVVILVPFFIVTIIP